MNPDALLDLLRRFQAEGVQYVLVGGPAVRLNGFTRNTGDIEDIDIVLPSSIENGHKVIRALNIDGLLKTKTDYGDKDRIDREALERQKRML